MAQIRITGGSIKGKKLSLLTEGPHRYTSGKVREAIFNMTGDIGHYNVLDLFAGAGTFSIECLSRGASLVTSVESSGKMFNVLQRNIRDSCFEKTAILLNMDVAMAIPLLHKKNNLYDIIFMDPPYGKDLIRPTVKAIMEYPIHNNETLFIIEYSKKDSLQIAHLFDPGETTVKHYGDTMVQLLTLPHSTMEGEHHG